MHEKFPMCPKCGGPAIMKPLFTSMYAHCVPCDGMLVKAPVPDNPPFPIGATVYPRYGGKTAEALTVMAIENRPINRIRVGGVFKEMTWVCLLKGRHGWRYCDRYTMENHAKGKDY